MKNYDYGFHNWSIIIELEGMIETMMTDSKVRKLISQEGQQTSNMTMLRSGNKDDIKEVLLAQHENLEKYLRYSLKHDFSKDINSGVFPIERIMKNPDYHNNFFYFTTTPTGDTQIRALRAECCGMLLECPQRT